MSDIGLITRKTAQSNAFIKAFTQFIEQRELPVTCKVYFYPDCPHADAGHAALLLSPEVALFEKTIAGQIGNQPLLTCKPVDFGMKNIEKIWSQLQLYF